MLNYLKSIGKGSRYEFEQCAPRLPSRIKEERNFVPMENMWFDRHGTRYSLNGNVLEIKAPQYFPDEDFTIIDYINAIPEDSDIQVVLSVGTGINETAGINMLCHTLSYGAFKRDVIIDITHNEFAENMALDVDNLPNNVKISSMMGGENELKENFVFASPYFDSWAMNCNDEKFEILLEKLAPSTKERISRMRQICKNFYDNTPQTIREGNYQIKSLFAYEMCCKNISYDLSATMPDGTFKHGREDALDVVFTYDNKKGVCAGRAALLKLLLNNYYMKVPCYTVEGKAGRLDHVWNEILLEDGSILDLDISKQNNRVLRDQRELTICTSKVVDNKKIWTIG